MIILNFDFTQAVCAYSIKPFIFQQIWQGTTKEVLHKTVIQKSLTRTTKTGWQGDYRAQCSSAEAHCLSLQVLYL